MKKIFNKFGLLIGVVVFTIFVLVIYYINNDNSRPLIPSVNLTQEVVDLSINNKVSLLAYVDNVSNYSINWTSSNESVAIVNAGGIVTALSEGTAIITASYLHQDGKVYSDNCLIKVSGGIDVEVTDINFLGEELVISKNSETTIEPIILPTDATLKSVKYNSKDLSIATIDSDGILKTLAKGTVMIEVTVNDKYTDYLTVNVVDETSVNEYITVPTALIFDNSELVLKIGDTKKLFYQISPRDASDKYLTWQSSNNDIVDVSKGVITAKKEGNAIINVSYNNRVLDNIIVKVSKNVVDVIGVSLTAKETKLKVNETLQLDYKVYPENASNKDVVFTSSDETVATVSKTGLITAKKSGTTNISVSTLEGNFTKTISITVVSSSTGGGSAICDDGYGSKPGSVCSGEPHLILNGTSLYDMYKLEIRKGETIIIDVNMPTNCGRVTLLTRTTASGEDGWKEYFDAYSDPFVNRYDCSTAIQASSYQWVITGKKVTNRYIELSQTAEMMTTEYSYVKPMISVLIKVNP